MMGRAADERLTVMVFTWREERLTLLLATIDYMVLVGLYMMEERRYKKKTFLRKSRIISMRRLSMQRCR